MLEDLDLIEQAIADIRSLHVQQRWEWERYLLIIYRQAIEHRELPVSRGDVPGGAARKPRACVAVDTLYGARRFTESGGGSSSDADPRRSIGGSSSE